MTKVKDTTVEKESVTKPSNENVTPPAEDPNKIVMLGSISYTDEKQYEELYTKLHNIDLTKVIEEVDNTDQKGEIACGADGCEVI